MHLATNSRNGKRFCEVLHARKRLVKCPGASFAAIAFLAISFAMLGCTPNHPFRTSFDPPGTPGADPHLAVIESSADYNLGFVEFDDQGWLWNVRQRNAVEQMVRSQAGIDGAPDDKPQGIILVAFVHGWKDNASYDGDGVVACRDILTQLSQAERTQSVHSPRKVVGIYVGWRGLSAKWEPFKELSFWERKETAHKVGGYGAMTKLLVDLENIQADSLKALPKEAPRTELIIIGHSFGGAAVYSALAQIITERFVDSVERRHQRLKPLGDQIILLNPAFEALRHFDLNQLAVTLPKYPQDQRPVLSIFTSKGDWATHDIFPIGQFFATLFQNNSSEVQRKAGLQTVGWYSPFVTHNLTYSAKAAFSNGQISTINAVTQKHEYHPPQRLEQSMKNVRDQRSRWEPNAAKPKTYCFDDCVLEPIDSYRPGDPFLIVSVDKQIMANHGDITNKVLINFLREYIQFCQTDVLDHRVRP
jgi:hypothetical protein